ncbi:PAS domain-containing protein [Phormidesmis priestleyi]
MMSDATDSRLKAEAFLRSQEQQIAGVLAKLPDLISRYDRALRYLYVSPVIEQVTGTAPYEFIGKTHQEMGMPEEIVAAWGENLRAVFATGEERSTQFRYPGIAGVRYFDATLIPEFGADGLVETVLVISRNMTDRQRAEEKLSVSQEFLALAQKAGKIGSFDWDVKTGISRWSEQLEEMFGFAVGGYDGSYEQWRDRIHPDDISRIEQSFQEAMRQQILDWQSEYRVLRFDSGELRWVDARGQFFYDESGTTVKMIGVVIDISDRKRVEDERKQSEEALKQSELVFRNLADTMPQMFWITRPNGYHEYYNQRWYEYTGAVPEQTQGEGWSTVLHPDDVERTVQIWQESLRTGKFYNVEYRFRRAADGQYRWHIGRAFPLRDETGQVVKWFGSCTDIHDQKCAIEERDQALERERSARAQAETANRIKDEFLAVLSHELRSPLNPILGWTKLLKGGKCDEPTRDRALDIIDRNAKLQSQLIEDLLDVSRILRGKLKLVFASVNLATTIDAALETVRLSAQAKSVEVKFLEEAESPLRISGDFNRLQQVIWNLLSNAVKFTPEGGRVTVQLQQIGSISSPFAQITIADTGKGISPDFLPHIFEQFRQADSSTTRSFGGLGLGLAIVKQLVELHNGTIQAASQGEGLGTTFTVKLPLLLREAAPAPSRPSSFDCPTDQPLCALKILVVDDDADSREILNFVLQEQGAIVTTVSSASEALTELSHNLPDLILSDLGMPEMDGYSLMRQVRKLAPEQGGEIPSIAVTAYAREEDRDGAIAAGFQDYLTKPTDSVALVTAIAALTKRAE